MFVWDIEQIKKSKYNLKFSILQRYNFMSRSDIKSDLIYYFKATGSLVLIGNFVKKILSQVSPASFFMFKIQVYILFYIVLNELK